MWLGTPPDMADPDAEDPVLRQSTRLDALWAFETQATYDLVRWETEVFANFGVTLDVAARFGLEQVLLSFYGMNELEELYEEPVVSYREEVDMMGLMSADDPPMRIENIYEINEYPFSVGSLYHHPNHARSAAEAGKAAGVEIQAVVPELGIDDSEGETYNAFLLRHLP